MLFSFLAALLSLGPDVAFRLINAARPAASYLYATILPERPMLTYEVKNASMVVHSTMAGLVGMDSPYPQGGVVDASTFLQQSAKIANTVVMSEEALRTLQSLIAHLQLSGASTNERMVEEVLNFTNALIVQPHLDTAEWLRGQALCTGAIAWTFGGLTLSVDYGIPAGNKLTHRTGNDAYAGSSSKFWDDVRSQSKLLRASSRIVRIAHPDLIEDIIANPVNAIRVNSEDTSMISITRMISQNGTNTPSSDARDAVTIIKYGLESEVLDPTDTSKTKIVPFHVKTKLLAVGTGPNNGYVVGAGSRQPTEFELGYTHLAPTVEGGGSPGRWARVYTPEQRPWQLVGEGVQNSLPVIDARAAQKRIVIASSALSS
jgi:hypothetical protein